MGNRETVCRVDGVSESVCVVCGYIPASQPQYPRRRIRRGSLPPRRRRSARPRPAGPVHANATLAAFGRKRDKWHRRTRLMPAEE
eukprot:2585411-Pleurochrysis_carterae.AAC.2